VATKKLPKIFCCHGQNENQQAAGSWQQRRINGVKGSLIKRQKQKPLVLIEYQIAFIDTHSYILID